MQAPMQRCHQENRARSDTPDMRSPFRYNFQQLSGRMVRMDWANLGKTVVERRQELGFDTRDKFAHHANLSARLLADLENGRRSSYEASTINKLETALNWQSGSAERILQGESPIPAAAGSATFLTPSPGISVAGAPLPEPLQAGFLIRARQVQEQLQQDLETLHRTLGEAAEFGVVPTNSVELRILIHHCSPPRMRQPGWQLVVATVEQGRLWLPGLADTPHGIFDQEFPWPPIEGSDLVSVEVCTSRAVALARGRGEALPVGTQELVAALPERTANVIINPGPWQLVIPASSLRDALRLVESRIS